MKKTNDELKILAFDQASNLTGYSLMKNNDLISYGIFDIHDINKKIYGECYYDEKINNVVMFLERCYDFFKPDLVVFENVQKQANIKTFKDLSFLLGCLKNYCYKNNIPYCILSSNEWRKELKIRGNKREILKQNSIKYVEDKFHITVGDDISDSICINVACKSMLDKKNIIIYKS